MVLIESLLPRKHDSRQKGLDRWHGKDGRFAIASVKLLMSFFFLAQQSSALLMFFGASLALPLCKDVPRIYL
jgi:hypothetical protein